MARISKQERERREALMLRIHEGCLWCFQHLITDGMPIATAATLHDGVMKYIADYALYSPTTSPTQLGLVAYYHFKPQETDDARNTEPSYSSPV